MPVEEKALIQIRCNLSEKKLWATEAAENDMSLADYVRFKMSKKTRKHIPKHDPQLVFAVNRIGVNLNQIARMLHSKEISINASTIQLLVSIEREMHEILKNDNQTE